MSQPTNHGALLPTALLALLAAGVWHAPSTGTSTLPQAPAARASAGPAAETAADETSVDALALLADYLGQDVSTRGILRAVGHAADLLASKDVSTDERRNAARLVADFSALPFTPYAARFLPDVTRIGQRLRIDPPGPVPELGAGDREILRAFTATYLDDTPQKAKLPEYGIERISRDLDTIDMSPLKRDIVDAERRRRNLNVRFLVATAPDPIDSYVGWVFDPFMDAFRRAVESQHYVMDRFHLPDWSPARDRQRGNSGTLHERNPGLLLFRHVENPNALLLVLLVTETPTAGLHQEAFQHAIRFVYDWDGKNQTVRLVGPSFSGSVPSLVSAMEQARRTMSISFDVMTGAATAPSNRRDIEATGASFGATIHDKETLSAAAELFLRDRILGRSSNEHAYALLTESNTGFGQSVEAALHRALKVHFPMHISRLHAAGQLQQAGATQMRPFGTPPMRPLNLDDGRVASDQLPTLWPALAESATELMVNNVLQTIGSERVRVVGILATDSRDTLFLTQQLAQVAPNMVVYGMESDLLYTHPDFSASTRGMLLVTTYPLYNRNQEWTFPGPTLQKREMFYSSVAEGLYNAVVLQLTKGHGAPDAAPPKPVMELRSPLLEYADPLKNCSPCTPPVWVTVVGRDRLWPVRVYGAKELDARRAGHRHEAPYITAVVPSWTGQEFAPANQNPGVEPPLPAVYFEAAMWTPIWVSGATVVLVILMLLHGLSFLSESLWSVATRLLRWTHLTTVPSVALTFSKPVPLENQPSGTVKHLLACFTALLGVNVYIACLFWTWMTSSRQQAAADVVVLVIAAAGIGASLALLTYAVLWLVSALFIQERVQVDKCLAGDDPVRRALQAVRRVLVGGVGAVTLSWYVAVLVDVVSSAPGSGDFTPAQVNAVLWYERSVQIMSGVSPTLPVLALALSVYLWGVQGLRRRVGHDDVKLSTQLFLADKITRYQPVADKRRRQAFTHVFVAAAVFVLYAIALRGGVIAFEGTAYASMYYWGGLLAEILVAGSLVSMAFYWRSVGARLLRLQDHPVLAAFTRLPDNLVTPRNLIQTPRLQQTYPLADRARRLALTPAGAAAGRIAVSGALARQGNLRAGEANDAKAVWQAFGAEVSECATDRWTSSDTWRESRALVTRIVAELQDDWDRCGSQAAPMPSTLAAAATSAPMAAPNAPCDLVKQLKEEIVAVHLALTLREVFAGMAGRAIFSLVTVFLLLASHTFFPFEPHRTLVTIAWMNVLVVIGIGSIGLFSLERNHVLRVMSQTRDGDHSRTTLVWRLIVFAVVPLLSLFAVAFPEIGTSVLDWIEPMQKVF